MQNKALPSANLQRRRLGGALALMGGLGLVGCGDRTPAAAAVAPAQTPAVAQPIPIKSSSGPDSAPGARASEMSGKPLADLYALITSKMHGFQSGNGKSTTAIVVVFDPQCPHCGRVWVESHRLNQEVHFAWMPVPLMNKDSLTQGAMLLGATDPIAFMTAHERLLLDNKGGAPLDQALFEKGKALIEVNRQLAVDVKIDVVPMIFHKKASGEILMTKGGVRAEELVVLVQS